jgi:hypothetical protein
MLRGSGENGSLKSVKFKSEIFQCVEVSVLRRSAFSVGQTLNINLIYEVETLI